MFLKKQIHIFLFAFVFNLIFFINCAYGDGVLYLTQDTAESNNFKRVLSLNDQVLAFGKAEDIFKGDPRLIQLSQNIKSPDELNAAELTRIAKIHKPRAVVSGMASKWQAQVLNFYKNMGIPVAAYYDNFDPAFDKEGTVLKPYISDFMSAIDESGITYLLPSKSAVDSFKRHEKTKKAPLRVVGKPSLLEWDDIYAKTDEQQLRKALDIHEKAPLIVFAGGSYKDESYAPHVATFIKAVKGLPYQVVVTLHPASDGEVERSLVKELETENVTVLEKQRTAPLTKLAKLVVCHMSSVGPDALHMEKPVLFVAPKEYVNLTVERDLAQRSDDEKEIRQIVQETMTSKDSPPSLEKALGIPEDPIKAFYEAVAALYAE